jgi:hypothetical protein
MGDQWPRGWSTRANQAETLNLKQMSSYFTNATQGRGARLVKLASSFGKPVGQPVTVKVADATLALWRPLTWKVSFLPG